MNALCTCVMYSITHWCIVVNIQWNEITNILGYWLREIYHPIYVTYTGCYNKCDFWDYSVFNESRRWAPHIYNMGNLASKIKHCIIQIVLWQKSIPLCCLHLSISHSHTITIPTHLGQGKICNHHSLFTLEGCTM